MNVGQVTYFPIPPVKPVVYPKPNAPADERAQPPARALTHSHVGRNLDLKV